MATDNRPILWRPDPLAEKQFKLPVSVDLHREAGKRGFSCIPKFSYTSRAYVAEIMKLERQANGSWRNWPNYRLGTGKTPLEAAVDGYKQAMPGDPLFLAFGLEIQATLLAEDVVVIRALEAALADLTDLVRSCNVLPWVEPLSADPSDVAAAQYENIQRGLLAYPDEDDDL